MATPRSMPERHPTNAIPARYWVAGCAVSLIGLLALIYRLAATDGTLSPIDGFWLASAAVAGAFVAGGWLGARRSRSNEGRSAESIAKIVATGNRMLGGERGLRIARTGPAEVAELASLLNRMADLRESVSAVLVDRDAQLRAIESMTGWIYWEQDCEARYTRIESAAGDAPPWRKRLLGRARWETGASLLAAPGAGDRGATAAGDDWCAHRDRIARRDSAADLLWSLPLAPGHTAVLHETAVPRVNAAGEFCGYRGVIREVVAQVDPLADEASRRREQALVPELAEARARIGELERSAEELESFSYSVSHDLRAPIRVVDGFARIVKEDFGASLDAVGHAHLDRILSAAARMNRMIDSLLALGRVAAGGFAPEPVELSAIAREIVDELRTRHSDRDVDVVVEDGLHASADPTLIRLVLENLLDNAWKYSARAAAPRVEFGATRDGAQTIYTVADNGAGFDMRFADRLFRVFQRLHSASEFPGTGVGLATVARIVRRHGGRIWATGTPGQGARFSFTLEANRAADSGSSR